MSISSTGLYGSATIVNSDLFNDVEDLKEQVTTLSSSYLTTTNEHRVSCCTNPGGVWTFVRERHVARFVRERHVALHVMVNKISVADIDNLNLFKLREHPQIGTHIQGMKSEINKYHALVQSSTL